MLCKPFTFKLEQTQLHSAEGHNALDIQYFIQLILHYVNIALC